MEGRYDEYTLYMHEILKHLNIKKHYWPRKVKVIVAATF